MKHLRIVAWIIAIAALLFQIYVDLFSIVHLSLIGRCAIVLIEVLGLIYIYVETRDRRIIYLLFFIYLLNLFYLLLLDSELGRDYKSYHSIMDYLQYNVNIIPMHTICLFYYAYNQHILSLSIITVNIIGNIIVFMPMAYFLPTLFNKQNKGYIFFITVSIIIILFEIIQVITMSGCGDIDDYLLNITGAMVMFIIIKLIRKKREA